MAQIGEQADLLCLFGCHSLAGKQIQNVQPFYPEILCGTFNKHGYSSLQFSLDLASSSLFRFSRLGYSPMCPTGILSISLILCTLCCCCLPVSKWWTPGAGAGTIIHILISTSLDGTKQILMKANMKDQRNTCLVLPKIKVPGNKTSQQFEK